MSAASAVPIQELIVVGNTGGVTVRAKGPSQDSTGGLPPFQVLYAPVGAAKDRCNDVEGVRVGWRSSCTRRLWQR